MFHICRKKEFKEEMNLESANKDAPSGPPGSLQPRQHCSHVIAMGSCNLVAIERLLVPNIRTSQRIPLSSYLWMENFAGMKGYH